MRLQKAELEACDEEPAPEAIETENPPTKFDRDRESEKR